MCSRRLFRCFDGRFCFLTFFAFFVFFLPEDRRLGGGVLSEEEEEVSQESESESELELELDELLEDGELGEAGGGASLPFLVLD